MSSITRSGNARRRRRLITVLWTAVLTLVTVSLIYWEMTAILYIVATLSVTALLVVVALADLRGSEGAPGDLTRTEDASNIGSKVSPRTGS